MMRILVFCFLLSLISCRTHTIQAIRCDIPVQEFQSNLIENYSGDQSPLNPEELKSFNGLDFFPINDAYKVTAHFEELNTEEVIPLKTSKNSIKQYKKYGKLSFILHDIPCELFVYQPYPISNEYKDYLFLPFMDETTGSTSYGAGRYIDLSIKEIKENRIVIDFNKSYNPYCAYSPRYNCPITPFENTLETAVEAGIRYIIAD